MSRVALLWILIFAASASALETDQFTVPQQPLEDLGAMLDEKIVADLEMIVAAANADRRKWLAEANRARSAKWRKIYHDRAIQAVSQQALADAVYDAVAAAGVPRCRIERWLEDRSSGRFARLQSTPIGDSVYGGNPFQRPPLLVEVSPTIRLHDQYMGVDKVGHFFQQGHEYFNAVRRARDAGLSDEDAVRDAVAHGVSQEHGFYGEMTIGVYSNADLAANYAGLLFYRNLLETVRVGDRTLAPIITWEAGRLVLTNRARGGLLKPFITEHWNESMNPSRYAKVWRKHLRPRVAERGEAWLAFHQSTLDAEAVRLDRIVTFLGQDYGHSGLSELVTIVNAYPVPQDAVAAR